MELIRPVSAVKDSFSRFRVEFGQELSIGRNNGIRCGANAQDFRGA
jgi:hypothetical protein